MKAQEPSSTLNKDQNMLENLFTHQQAEDNIRNNNYDLYYDNLKNQNLYPKPQEEDLVDSEKIQLKEIRCTFREDNTLCSEATESDTYHSKANFDDLLLTDEMRDQASTQLEIASQKAIDSQMLFLNGVRNLWKKLNVLQLHLKMAYINKGNKVCHDRKKHSLPSSRFKESSKKLPSKKSMRPESTKQPSRIDSLARSWIEKISHRPLKSSKHRESPYQSKISTRSHNLYLEKSDALQEKVRKMKHSILSAYEPRLKTSKETHLTNRGRKTSRSPGKLSQNPSVGERNYKTDRPVCSNLNSKTREKARYRSKKNQHWNLDIPHPSEVLNNSTASALNQLKQETQARYYREEPDTPEGQYRNPNIRVIDLKEIRKGSYEESKKLGLVKYPSSSCLRRNNDVLSTKEVLFGKNKEGENRLFGGLNKSLENSERKRHIDRTYIVPGQSYRPTHPLKESKYSGKSNAVQYFGNYAEITKTKANHSLREYCRTKANYQKGNEADRSRIMDILNRNQIDLDQRYSYPRSIDTAKSVLKRNSEHAKRKLFYENK